MDQLPNRYGEKETGRVTTVKRGHRERASQGDFLRKIREKFPRICEPSLRQYNKAKATLHLRENVRAVFKPKRPVPYAALVWSVEAELVRLVKQGVISKVDYSTWGGTNCSGEETKREDKNMCRLLYGTE